MKLSKEEQETIKELKEEDEILKERSIKERSKENSKEHSAFMKEAGFLKKLLEKLK